MAGIDSNAIWMSHCDGSDASTTFTDSSQYAHTATAVGNAQVDTAQAKFDQSCLLDGTGDRVHIGDTSLLDVGTGDWTFDTWVRFNSLASGLCCFAEWGSYSTAGWLAQLSGTTFQVYVNNSARNWTWSPSTATWYHLAIERYSGNLYVYVDGTKLAAGQASSEDISGSSSGASFGDTHTLADRAVNGWMDEVRWSNISRYSGADFTPETVPYSAISGPANIKAYDGLASASVKTIKGLAIASVKTYNGLA